MEGYILIREMGLKFKVRETGGEGNCLFSSLAVGLQRDNHRVIRKKIVNYISSVKNWPSYQLWAKYDFKIHGCLEYTSKMKRCGESGTSLECRAASELYKRKVNIVRVFNHGNYFIQAFGSTAELPTICLFFTGVDNSNGHFQLLEPSADFLGNFKVLQKARACTASLALSNYYESGAWRLK